MIRDAFAMHIRSRPALGIERLIASRNRVFMIECNGYPVCRFYGPIRELSLYWPRILHACRTGQAAELNR